MSFLPELKLASCYSEYSEYDFYEDLNDFSDFKVEFAYLLIMKSFIYTFS